MNSKSVAFSIALILAFVDFGSCVKCYHCDSQKDTKCAATFTSTVQAMDCESASSRSYNEGNLMNILPAEIFTGVIGEPKYCHKLVFDSGTVFRTCLSGKSNKDATCKTIIDETKNGAPGGKVSRCFTCDTDGCNGAGSLSVSLPLSIVAFVVSYLLYKQ